MTKFLDLLSCHMVMNVSTVCVEPYLLHNVQLVGQTIGCLKSDLSGQYHSNSP